MAKNLYLNAQDDQRFLNYIKHVQSQDIKPISNGKRTRILQKALLKHMENSSLA